MYIDVPLELEADGNCRDRTLRIRKERGRMDKEMLLEIRVLCQEPMTVKGHTRDIVMIPFTGEAWGPKFQGTIAGSAVDTQKIPKGGEAFLSARYMIRGQDSDGNSCQVFIENEGNGSSGFHPTIVTDSPLLGAWETMPLKAEMEGIPHGVLIRIMEA